MVQVPAPKIVTVLSFTVQIDGVVDVKVTGRPDVAVAPMVNGGVSTATLLSGPKTMVCAFVAVTVNVLVTGTAGANVPSPAWVASIEQAPVLRSVAAFPEAWQTPGVVDAKSTRSPDDAVATRGMLPVLSGVLLKAPNVMVWGVPSEQLMNVLPVTVASLTPPM